MTFLTILFAILMFSVIIFVHELGHFVSARIFGVTVHEFAIGMGPALFSKKGKGGTLYSIRAIPVGGFCKMEGEDEDSDDNGSFSKKSPFARLVILASGAFMNVVLGLVISLIVTLMTMNQGLVSTTVSKTVTDAPISAYIKSGDKIIEVNGRNIHLQKEIAMALSVGNGESCDLKIKRDGEIIEYENVPLHRITENGVSYTLLGVVCQVKDPTVFGVIRESFFETVYMGKVVFMGLGMLINGEASLRDLSSPVGVVSQMGDVAASSGGGFLGFLNLLYLAGFITVNIGIMNLLPLPALDGGRILFVFIELVVRRRVPPEKEGIVHFAGLILLFGLMIFATWNDILRLIGG